MDYTIMELKDIAALPGVRDLRTIVKAKFAQALRAEARGETEIANRLLDEAVAKEQEG